MQTSSSQQNALLCRFGVNHHQTATSSITDYDLASLRSGSYIDYGAAAAPQRPNGIRYVPVIRLKQKANKGYSYTPSGAVLDAAIAANPAAVWYIGNEPDRRVYQDDIEPDIYARAYHELYTKIKAVDPTAKVFPGSIVQASELRLRYLDLVLDAYRAEYAAKMPLDGWSIHGFILPELGNEGAGIPPGMDDEIGLDIDLQENDSVELFVEQIERFRNWMYTHRYRDVPLYLSEYGVLVPEGYDYDPEFTAERVNTFMDATFDYLRGATNATIGYPPDGNRLVQHMSWYSTNDKGFNGFLFDVDNGDQRSPMGENYAAYTGAIDAAVDFFPVKIYTTPSAPLSVDGATELTIHAEIANSGNLQAEQPVEISFYDGDPADGGAQIGDTQTLSLTGCGATKTVTMAWPDVAPDTYQIFVSAKAAGDVDDVDESNDTAPKYVFFANHKVYLPIVD